MKKLLLTAAAVFVTLSIYAQGTVDFRNDANTPIRNSLTGANAVAADGIRVALFWAPLSDPQDFVQLGNFATVASPTPIPGIFIGGNRTTGNETPPNGTGWFLVKAWEASRGATYEEAVAAPQSGGRGALAAQSAPFRLNTGSVLTTPANLAGPYNNETPMTTSDDLPGFQGLTVVPVPEPSIIALGLLGAGSLLLFRRRK